jgi:hypothetical protein
MEVKMLTGRHPLPPIATLLFSFSCSHPTTLPPNYVSGNRAINREEREIS